MEKLYYQTPYVKMFQAVVVSCTEGRNQLYEVVLDQTGFYPEGGGQPADTGTLGKRRVLDVHEQQGTIVHYIDGPLVAGTKVNGIIDWEKRYSNMQQHSGEHILSGLVYKRYGYHNVGFHMGSEGVTVDFDGPLTMEQVEEIEQEANRLVYDNLPVRESYPTPTDLHKLDYRSKKEINGQVRIIEIPGGDICACCGTHVETTGEIGVIKVLGLINYKGGVRLTMACGMSALIDYEKKQQAVTGISNLLSAKPELIVEAVEKLKQSSGEKDMLIHQLYQQLFQEKVNQIPDSQNDLLLFEENLTPVLLRLFCTMLYEQKKGRIVLVCSGNEGHYQYAIGSSAEDMRAHSKQYQNKLNGRGGGNKLMAQGVFLADRQEIEDVWNERT